MTLIMDPNLMTPHTPDVLIKWFARTDVGKVRKNNEDSFLGLQFDAQGVERLGKYGEGHTKPYWGGSGNQYFRHCPNGDRVCPLCKKRISS